MTQNQSLLDIQKLLLIYESLKVIIYYSKIITQKPKYKIKDVINLSRASDCEHQLEITRKHKNLPKNISLCIYSRLQLECNSNVY